MKFRTRYGEIYYEITGEGSALLLIHGTPFSSGEWSRIIEQIKHRYRVYTYDLLGYGHSAKAEEVSLKVQNKVLGELLDFWHLESPDVVAHDFGGATLLRSMILDHRSFNRIMLIDVVALTPWGSPFVRHVKQYETVFNQIPDYIHKAIVQAYIKDAIHRPVSDDEIQFLVDPWTGKIGKEAFYRQIAQMDERFTGEIEHAYPGIENEIRIL